MARQTHGVKGAHFGWPCRCVDGFCVVAVFMRVCAFHLSNFGLEHKVDDIIVFPLRVCRWQGVTGTAKLENMFCCVCAAALTLTHTNIVHAHA